MSIPATTNPLPEAPKRDWFGYTLTAVVGIAVTVLATWYQIYSTEKEATLAESERARAVRQSVITIVEEQALNGIPLEADRIGRLIDQRRRDQKVLMKIGTADVVEQAEFNIASSSYLTVARKEEVKRIFDALYGDLASRSFQAFPESDPNAELLNELAKQIQEGKSAQALASLRRLQEIYAISLTQNAKRSDLGISAALYKFFTDPLNLFIFIALYAAILRVLFVFRRRRQLSKVLDPDRYRAYMEGRL